MRLIWDKARMDAAIKFADTVLEHGRDTYGEKHTPLFVDGLNIDTMQPPEKTFIFKLGGTPTPRGGPWLPLISSNLGEQGNLMRFLVGLSNLRGDPNHKDAYKDCIRYHFKHYQWDSGLLRSTKVLPYHPRASHHWPGVTPTAACDEIVPENAQDNSVRSLTWSPHKGSGEWLEYGFEKPRNISSVAVYWFDDSKRGGGSRVPASWRVLYRRAGKWQLVEAAGEYGVAKDRFNKVKFKPVETDTLRLEVKLQPNRSGGILEWRVNP